MKVKNLKKSLEIAFISRLINHYSYFTIECSVKNQRFESCSTKTLIKISVNKQVISSYLNHYDLKYPLLIKSFENYRNFYFYAETINTNTVVLAKIRTFLLTKFLFNVVRFFDFFHVITCFERILIVNNDFVNTFAVLQKS